jgi:hypothetical protein
MDHASPVAQASLLDVAFDGYLKYKTYRVSLQDQESPLIGGFVHGPGHFVSAVAALAFDQAMAPYCTFKTGDTRLSRQERGEPYVLHGMVAGRMDKEGASASKIVLAELAEEVGGEVVEGTFLPLGAEPSPTMPWESTEADSYYLAAVEITGTPCGDGGAMEVVDLIGPLLLAVPQAMAAMDSGQVAEGGRARTMFCRGLDLIGYSWALGVYVHDHPRLLERFDTLGLGPSIDLRTTVSGSKIPDPAPKGVSLESRINEAVCVSRQEHAVDGHCRMVAATTQHAVRQGADLTTLGQPFPNEFLHLDYDRAKVVSYYLDPQAGPMVAMTALAYPALAFAPGSLRVVRHDILDFVVRRDGDALAQIQLRCGLGATLLGEKTSASSGQCDMDYYLAAVEVEPASSGFCSLAQAIGMCRADHGDSQTEATLQRLADRLGWLPTLGLTLAQAQTMLETSAVP